ncbi:MAG: Oligopeptide transport ATP-binding protein OppD [Firmicutes bacterium ADurb.Bin506]|nr:MAG: Oligopeptide transport ATP-binding protein OppD [Firmicutes bacterium ADurb.Bin506]
MSRLLEVTNLHTSFRTYAGEVQAVRGVSFHLDKGEAVAIVGESGCGKSVTALSIMQLVPPPGRVTAGQIVFEGKDLLGVGEKSMQGIRGNSIGMIFQDPMTSLNPVLTIKTQILESLKLHQNLSGEAATKRAIELLHMVGIPSPERRLGAYPHQFSGGMRQRVMIAMALACNPRLLIADEPTTALDVTIQAQILDLMKSLRDKLGMSIILITHDLGVVAGLAERVVVMYAGKIVEQGRVGEIFAKAQHPYTWGLLKSVPRLDASTKDKLVPIYGQPPDLISPPQGCPFAPRCDYAMAICKNTPPEYTTMSDSHQVACWLQHPMAPANLRVKRGGVA